MSGIELFWAIYATITVFIIILCVCEQVAVFHYHKTKKKREEEYERQWQYSQNMAQEYITTIMRHQRFIHDSEIDSLSKRYLERDYH